MPFSVRLDPETEAAIDKLAKVSGRSRASIVREAIVRYASDVDDTQSAYDRLKPLVGVMRSGRSDLSQKTGKRFTELLKQRAERARRPR